MKSQYFQFPRLSRSEGCVTVEGCISSVVHLSNMVFQGTVLGPTLWNAFFSDIVDDVGIAPHECNLFADDLTVFSKYPQTLANEVIRVDLEEAQHRSHLWGMKNRVTFDAAKESIHILHPRHGDDSEFKMLGILIDSKVSFKPLIDALLNKCRPKAKAIARLRNVMSTEQLLGQFKTHV